MLETQKYFAQYITTSTTPDKFKEQIKPCGKLKSAEAALEVYRRGYFARLTEALGETFEGVWSILGDDIFFLVCKKYIEDHPSKSYNLSAYGDSFAKFLQNSPESLEFLFLPDLAKFEWLFKELFHSEAPLQHLKIDGSLTAQSRFDFLPSAALFYSEYSIYELWQRRLQNTRPKIDIYVEQFLLCYKASDSKIWVHKLKKWEFAIIQSLMKNASIEGAVTNFAPESLEADDITQFFTKLKSFPILNGIQSS